MAARTNEEWRAALAGDPDPAALAELRAYLRRGLAAAVRSPARGGPLDEAALEDLTQDALLRVLERHEGFRGESRFTTWAMAIAVRLALSALRSRRATPASLEEIVEPVVRADPASDPALGVERAEAARLVRRAIDEELTPRQRLAILARMAGLPSVVTADKLGISPNALYKLDHDARRKLRGALLARGLARGGGALG